MVEMLFFQLHRSGAESVRFGLSTADSLVCSPLPHTAVQIPMDHTGVLGLVGNACRAPLAGAGAWGSRMPVLQP